MVGHDDGGIKRREVLGGLLLGAGAAVVLPERWVRPVLDVVVLPAHACTSWDDYEPVDELPPEVAMQVTPMEGGNYYTGHVWMDLESGTLVGGAGYYGTPLGEGECAVVFDSADDTGGEYDGYFSAVVMGGTVVSVSGADEAELNGEYASYLVVGEDTVLYIETSDGTCVRLDVTVEEGGALRINGAGVYRPPAE